MTETVETARHTSGVPLSSGTGSATAGLLLKKAREAAGLHIGALAVSLKVPVSKLEALESGNLEQLSGAVFVRALASSVCRALKIDATEILHHLPQAITAKLHQKGELNEPFRGDGRGMSFSSPERLLKPSILAVVALLLGAGVLMLWPNLGPIMPSMSSSNTSDASNASSTSKEAVAEPPPPVMVLNGPDVIPPAESAPASTPAVVTQAPVQTVVSAVVKPAVSPVQPVATPLAVAPSPAPAGSSMVTVSGTGDMVVFKATATSWVEVTDAKGVVVLRKTLNAGEVAQVGGMAPLRAIVGRADVTEVTVRGKRMDMKAVSKDNVARFEVK